MVLGQRKGEGEGVNNTEGRRRTGGIRRSEEGGGERV